MIKLARLKMSVGGQKLFRTETDLFFCFLLYIPRNKLYKHLCVSIDEKWLIRDSLRPFPNINN